MARTPKSMPPVAEPKRPARSSARRTTAPAALPVPVAPGRGKSGPASAATARKKPDAVAPVPAATPKLAAPSKGELRAQIAKLEAENAKFKARSRDARRAAKASDGRIGELEAEVTRLQEQVSRTATSVVPERPAKPARAGRSTRRKGIDPGDAVPPGVAVEQPEPMDAEAEAALDALERHIPGR